MQPTKFVLANTATPIGQPPRSSFRDPASSDQPSPNRDGGDPYPNREKRDARDARIERKVRPATIAELADKSREDLRATTIILEKMPTHRDYHTLLTPSQRNNLALVSLYLPPPRRVLSRNFVLVVFNRQGDSSLLPLPFQLRCLNTSCCSSSLALISSRTLFNLNLINPARTRDPR